MNRMRQSISVLILSGMLLTACSATPTPTSDAGSSAAMGDSADPAAKTLSVAPTATVAPAVVTASSPAATATSSVASDQPTATMTPGAMPTTAPAGAPFEPRVEVVAENLIVPWSLAFAPDGRLFFTERPGRLRVMVAGVLQSEPVAEFEVLQSGEGGLLGIALDPDFGENRRLYAMYTYADAGSTWNRVSRFVVSDSGLQDEEIILDRVLGAIYHDGGRLAFGPDGKLYVTTGDAGNPGLAQDAGSLAGKILRLNPDGTVPGDNPTPGSPVYSLGHRNPQGLAWHRDTGLLYSTEHGPSGEQGLCCRDELNLIEAGGNYGWPIVTMVAGDARFVDPLLNSGSQDTWAPGSLLAYRSETLSPWQGNLFFGALRGQHLQRVRLSADGRTVIEAERLFDGEYGRIRDVAEGPDGYIYFTTSNRDGRGAVAAEDDRILRIVSD